MLATRERWTDLCKRICARANISRVNYAIIDIAYDDLIAAYTDPGRYYHNLDHINDGLAKFDEAKHLAKDPDSLEMAWWRHDSVYNPTEWDNELQSALDANIFLRELGLERSSDHTLRMKIFHSICATEHKYVPIDPDQQLIIDIDLASLGTPPEIFDLNTANIRKEYWMIENDGNFFKGRAQFFRKFLGGRPSIYLTEYFKEKYEAQAQENLRRIIAEFDK